jgi:hypothetical protein
MTTDRALADKVKSARSWEEAGWMLQREKNAGRTTEAQIARVTEQILFYEGLGRK